MNAQSTITPLDLIQSKLDLGHEIRPFPRVVSQLIAAFDDPQADSKKFARIIEADAVLSARLLRMANSPIYGFSNVIRTIEHATVVLGIGPLKNVALTYAGSSMFASGETAAEPREELWNHSLGCATVARVLAKQVNGVEPDAAFLGGIFHDIGKLFFYDVVPNEYLDLALTAYGELLIEQEREHFGITHEEVGAKLTSSWQLPEAIRIVVGHHHHPHAAIAHSGLTSVVHVADLLARAVGIGSPGNLDIDVFEAASEFLQLSTTELQQVHEQATDLYESTLQAYVE